MNPLSQRAGFLAAVSFFTLCAGLLSGCGVATVSSVGDTQPTGAGAKTAFTGNVHGGQQPVTGAHVYLFAVGTTGYSATNASLLTAGASGVQSDAVGTYVLTDSGGGFTITGDYTCPATVNTPMYLVALGGNPGLDSGTNPNLALMAALGSCDTVKANAASIFVSMNEVTTVATMYALAPFAVNTGTGAGIAFSTSSTNLTGMSNAFGTFSNLVDLATGTARSATPDGSGIVPQAEINSLADSLQSCINSAGGAALSGTSDGSACGSLFSTTVVSGLAPTNTLVALFNLIQHPDQSAASIFNLAPAAAAFSPQLSSAPSDWTLAITYKGGGIATPQAIAIDANGNAWVSNQTNVLTEVGTNGFATGASGKALTTLDAPVALAVDTGGNLWISNCGSTCSGSSNASSLTYYQPGTATELNFTSGGLHANYAVAVTGSNLVWAPNTLTSTLTLMNNTGVVSSGTSGYTAAGLQYPVDAAVDAANNVWAVSPSANSLVVMNTGGATQTTSYAGSGLNYPTAIALDGNGRAWVANTGSDSVAVLSAGAPITGSPFTGGGLHQPNALAIDGAGDAWIANSNQRITELASSGAAISANGFTAAGLTYANGIAIDPSGNVWVTNCGSYCSGTGSDTGSIVEFVGVGVPTTTSLAVAALNNKIGVKP